MKEERQHKYKILTFLTLAFLLTGTLLTYHDPLTSAVASPVSQSVQNLTPPQPVVNRVVRVAIYNEPNMTKPSYATADIGDTNNNVTQLASMLQSRGFSATLLTCSDIYDHQLLTASYDVLALVDNYPRENITDMVREFWLGGGGLLVFDSAAVFLCYFGILPPDALGTVGRPAYWNYGGYDFNVTLRHPVSKAYRVNDTIDTDSSYGYVRWSWSALQSSSIGGDLKRVARSNDDPDTASVLAFDPTNRGGRVVTFTYDYAHESVPGIHQMIADAVDWLCPRPKARIVFDLSHNPRLGVDPWDTLAYYQNYYPQMRDLFVNRSYTFDKLYPEATGNFTASRLAPYDLLIIVTPDSNFTAADRTAVTNWVQAGGGVLALGERPTTGPSGFLLPDQRINYLLDSLNLRINTTTGSSSVDEISYHGVHPTCESCGDLYFAGFGYLNVTGSAYSIWNYTQTSNIVVAAQTYGQGRVVLAGDMNFPTYAQISESENRQYIVNLANWLTATKADVLIHVDTHYPSVKDPNWNIYRGPLAQALNDLGIPFYLTFTGDYFNMSLTGGTWTLVIFDNIYFNTVNYMDDVLNYMKAGGHLILSTWSYNYAAMASLNSYLGFSYVNYMSITLPSIYVWNSAHDVFAQPNHYGADNISHVPAYGWNFGSNVTTFSNATAIAGLGRTASTVNASIILSAGGRAVTNAISLSHYAGDTDDSTYPDNFEIWENEIAFMMRPRCTLTPIAAASVNQGTLTISANVTSLGLSAAMEGAVTLSIPAGFGTLLTSATQSIISPLDPSANGTATWQVNATGVGAYTLDFTAAYKGFKNTTYSAASTADIFVWGVFTVTAAFAPGTSVVQGTQIVANLTVKDYSGAAVTDASIAADLSGTTVTYAHLGGGVYRASISTTTLTPSTYSLNVNVSKTEYNHYLQSYTITVQAPGGGTTTTTTAGGLPLEVIAIVVIVVIALVVVLALVLRKRGGSARKR